MIRVQWFYCQDDHIDWMGYCPDLSLILNSDTEKDLIRDMNSIPHEMFDHMMNEVKFEKFAVIQGLNQWPRGDVAMKNKIEIEVTITKVSRIEIPH